MKRFFSSIKKVLNDNIFFKTYALILLPVFILLTFLLFSSYSYNKNYVKLLKNSYLTKLESICNENETSLQNIATMIRLLSENEKFLTAATGQTDLESKAVYNVSQILKQVIENNALIDSIAIFNRTANRVYTSQGTSNAINYFSFEYQYAEYTKAYWDDYKSPLSERKILAPSLVATPESQKIIIPIVFTKIGDIPTSNLVIVNVNLSKIISNTNNTKLTHNSQFLIINKQNRNIFNENNNFNASLGNNFFNELFTDNSAVFDTLVNNQKALVMFYSPSSSILGYTYTAIVPYSDINNSLSGITYIIVLTGILALLIVLGTAYFSTKRIYTPIEDLASLFENAGDNAEKKVYATNTLQRLHTSIQETLESNYSLSNEVSKVLPLVQERYLINLLNSNEHYSPDKDHTHLSIDFKYEYFCSIVIKLKPTDQFYNLYNNMEYNAIKAGIHSIIQSAFSEEYEAYIIPSETDTLYVLLNLPDSATMEHIIEILEDFQKVMDFDRDYMTVKIGIGGIYQHIDGLKKSHHEAVNSVSAFIGLTHVRVYAEEQIEKNTSYTFGMNDENALLNHLILGRTADAKILIENVLGENIRRNTSDTALIQLYIQILNIVFKVMRMKEIAYDTENSGDFHIITKIIKEPLPRVHETVMSYLNIISSHMGSSNTKVDIQAIISYMETNFNQDLCLENIADNFRTTPKYLSKLIKDKLGVNFIDYLAGLRISQAKVLLSETNNSISDIFTEVGFNNRNTFIRTFKKNTGLTPTEFRKSKKLPS